MPINILHSSCCSLIFFFFKDPATTEIYTLSLHDALPICAGRRRRPGGVLVPAAAGPPAAGGGQRDGVRRPGAAGGRDRKSTRLNSSHANISYAVFCLKKKKNNTITMRQLDQVKDVLQRDS